jgi:hypothetical protein
MGPVGGKEVVSKDGDYMGTCIRGSQQYLFLERGKVRKEQFWLPTFIFAQNTDESLFLTEDNKLQIPIGKKDIEDKYMHINEPDTKQYESELESFKREKSIEASNPNRDDLQNQAPESARSPLTITLTLTSLADELTKLQGLLEKKVITAEEFSQLKQNLLKKMQSS